MISHRGCHRFSPLVFSPQQLQGAINSTHYYFRKLGLDQIFLRKRHGCCCCCFRCVAVVLVSGKKNRALKDNAFHGIQRNNVLDKACLIVPPADLTKWPSVLSREVAPLASNREKYGLKQNFAKRPTGSADFPYVRREACRPFFDKFPVHPCYDGSSTCFGEGVLAVCVGGGGGPYAFYYGGP